MLDDDGPTPDAAAAPGLAVALSRADVAVMKDLLQRLDPTIRPLDPAGADGAGHGGGTGDAGAGGAASHGHDAGQVGLSQVQCIDLIGELEDLKTVAAGAQAAITAHLATARHDAEQATAIPAAKRGRGLAGEVALARRVSPHRGGQHLGMARALDADMPRTLAALRRGHLSEWRATLLVRESICLTAADRRALDAELWHEPDHLVGMGDRQLVALAKRLAYRLDPHSVVDRAARAERERHVSIRPAPDTMAYLTALLPVSQAVAAHAALTAAADAARATGDPRSRGQHMADTLVSRLTGTAADVPAQVHLKLVMSDHTLAGGHEPAYVPEHGTVPAGWARDLLHRALADKDGCGVWVRRLFTDPAGHLVAMESRSRHAPPGLASYIATRDTGHPQRPTPRQHPRRRPRRTCHHHPHPHRPHLHLTNPTTPTGRMSLLARNELPRDGGVNRHEVTASTVADSQHGQARKHSQARQPSHAKRSAGWHS